MTKSDQQPAASNTRLPYKTIASRMDECDGFGPGFDFIRIFLALAVLVWHSFAIVYGDTDAAKQTALWPFAYAILPMFFALSGFLVTGSALRLSLKNYIANRAFRIVPALGVDIFLCALVLGPLFSTFALSVYFADPLLYKYFLNIFGLIHYELPGVFLENTYPNVVNGSLWTVPYEIACYVLMSGLIWLGLLRRWAWVLGIASAILLTSILLYLLDIRSDIEIVQKLINFAFFAKGATLVPCFLAGAACYLLRGVLPASLWGAVVILAAMVMVGVFGDPDWFKHPVFIALSCFPMAFLVVILGMTRLPSLPVFNKGDYSYGVYLYHFPILQSLQQLFGFSAWWQLAVISVFPVTLFAAFSWHMIEKPVLLMRKKFSLVGARLSQEADNARRPG